MQAMGIKDTQYVVFRHRDADHPHCHIVFNRVSNSGKTIADKNDRYRSTKICRRLTEKHGLYIATGKENVKQHRLREPAKTKYEIYHSIRNALQTAKDWPELMQHLKRDGITVNFKYRSGTTEKQGVTFTKNNLSFNGSKVDRQFSYSKIEASLRVNEKRQSHSVAEELSQTQHVQREENSIASFLDQFTTIAFSGDDDENEPQEQIKKKRRRNGIKR